MKRRTVHRVFAGGALILAALTCYQGLQLVKLSRINRAIVSASASSSPSSTPISEPSEVALAQALAFARAGATDQAVKSLTRLAAGDPADAVARAALFDLGNLYLRQGAIRASESAAASLPLIELAKQRYRDLLRLDPEQWDARYNLERALRLAPEDRAAYAEPDREPVQRRNMMAPELIAPDLP